MSFVTSFPPFFSYVCLDKFIISVLLGATDHVPVILDALRFTYTMLKEKKDGNEMLRIMHTCCSQLKICFVSGESPCIRLKAA